MPKLFAILLLAVILGQTVQPAFASNCCASDEEMSCGISEEATGCCKTPALSTEEPTENPSHECPDDCHCFCCAHIAFNLPQLADFQTPENLLPELNISYPTYFFQISIPVFQPPQLV